MIDYSAMLYDPVYAELGVPATLTAGVSEVEITIIDDTRPKTSTSGSVEVRSVGPGAYARIPELIGQGVMRDDYIDAVLTFNGRTWVVRSYELRGSPNGEDVGEVRFLLKAIVLEESGTPDWVTADAKIHIDLVGNRAWTEANGEVAIDTLLGSDPNTDNGWAATAYNPESLGASGYANGGPAVAFIGAARDQILAGSTLVIKTAYFGLGGFNINPFAMVSTNGNAGVFLQLNGDAQTMVGGSYVGDLTTLSAAEINSGDETGATVFNTTAATFTPTRMEFAINGSEVATAALSSDDYPVSGDDQIVAALFDTIENNIAYQAITLYDPLPDTTGLSELSTDG